MMFPFDIREFIINNKDLVKRYLTTNTYPVFVPDFDVDKNHFYKNQVNILRSGCKFEFSDLQKLEYIKCMRDVVYFTKKYVKIISIDDGLIPFSLYDYQEELLSMYQKNRFVISMQCRQSGKTATTAAYLLHYATFNTSKTVAILANKASQAREILSRVQLSFSGSLYTTRSP